MVVVNGCLGTIRAAADSRVNMNVWRIVMLVNQLIRFQLTQSIARAHLRQLITYRGDTIKNGQSMPTKSSDMKNTTRPEAESRNGEYHVNQCWANVKPNLSCEI